MGHNASKRKSISLNDLAIPYEGVGKSDYIASCQEAISWISQSTDSIELKMLVKEVTHSVSKFAENFFLTKRDLKPYHLEDFVTACKNRTDDLIRLSSTLSLKDEEVEIVVAVGNKAYEATSLKYLRDKADIYLLSESDEDEEPDIFTIHRRPKFYSHLLLGILKCMQASNRLQHVNPGESRTCMELAQILISAGKIYLEFRSNSGLWAKKERDSLKLLKGSHTLDKTSKYYELLQEVRDDLKEGKLPYVREMRRAIDSQHEFINSPFGEKDYYYSAKASTSRKKSFGKQNSLVSSSFEIDHLKGHEIDSVIGYQSHYNRDGGPDYQDDLIKTMAINQHKLAPRIIHIANNAIQDRCNYLRRRLAAILANNPSDCTKDQDNGVRFVAQVTHPNYRLENGNPSVHCMDFSNATDTLDQEFQGICLGMIFHPSIIKFWNDVSRATKVFRFRMGSKESYNQSMGQPQGILGSFDAFAFAHHIIMLMVMKASGHENSSARKFYRVLGDDSAISTIKADPDRLVRKLYIEISAFAGLIIQPEKGLDVFFEDRTALAEFAKVTVLNGEITSPPPIRIMSRIETGTTNYYSFATAIWMMNHGYRLEGILDHLLDKWYGYDEQVRELADVMIYGGIISQFQKFHKPGRFSEELRAKVALCYSVTKIKGTIAENLLSDKVREDLSLTGIELSDAIASILPKDPEVFLDQIEDEEHKLLKAIQKNLIIEDSIKSILGLSDVRLILPLLDLTEQEITSIFSISDLLESATSGTLSEFSLLTVLSNNANLRTLDRFQLRSHHKQTAKEIEYLNNTLELFNKVFPSIA